MAFIDVIKYEATNDMLVFKHPITDFNKKAKLIVHENQEAIVFMNGEAQKLYPPGKYELESDNIPGVKHVIAMFSGGELANHCEVYYINKLRFANIPWVTSKMDIQDTTIRNYYAFWAQGYFSVRIENACKLFSIIGGNNFYSVESLKEYFKEPIASLVREAVSLAMNQQGISYGEINSHNSKLSAEVKTKVKPLFEDIGLSLEDFRFESVNVEKDEEFEKHRSHLGERSGQDIQGYTYDKKRTFDVLEKQAENQAAAGAASAVAAGVGFGSGIGQVYNGMVGQVAQVIGNPMVNHGQGVNAGNHMAGIVQPHMVQETAVSYCENCKNPIQSEWKYCPYCSSEIVANKRCPSCNADIPLGVQIKFCPNCSTKL